MEKAIIRLSVDVTKIDKSALITGKKGTYLDLTVFVKPEPDKFGNHCSVMQSQSEEDRAADVQPNWLGNGKVMGQKVEEKTRVKAAKKDDDDDLPF